MSWHVNDTPRQIWNNELADRSGKTSWVLAGRQVVCRLGCLHLLRTWQQPGMHEETLLLISSCLGYRQSHFSIQKNRTFVGAPNCEKPPHAIMGELLTMPTSIGYEQNLLIVYYCFDDQGGVAQCIAEVTNTFLFASGLDLVAKPSHVSPFHGYESSVVDTGCCTSEELLS